MNIVYKMTFLSRLENNTPPFYYIGMKTNCSFKDNIILGKNEKPYWSSSGSSKLDRKSTRLNSSHSGESRMPSSA